MYVYETLIGHPNIFFSDCLFSWNGFWFGLVYVRGGRYGQAAAAALGAQQYVYEYSHRPKRRQERRWNGDLLNAQVKDLSIRKK